MGVLAEICKNAARHFFCSSPTNTRGIFILASCPFHEAAEAKEVEAAEVEAAETVEAVKAVEVEEVETAEAEEVEAAEAEDVGVAATTKLHILQFTR